MELHYSREDIEPYEDYEDPQGVMLAHRRELGVPPPIPLAEPWTLGKPVLIPDEVSGPPPPADPVVEVDVADDARGLVEDEVANMVAVDWYGDAPGALRGEIDGRPEVGADDPEVWDEFLVPGPFAHVDPGLYRFETAAAPEAAVEAWMTAQPLADSEPRAALVRDRAEERLRALAPEKMAAYDVLRSEDGRAPLEAMRAVAPTVQGDDGSPAARATSPAAGAGAQPGPLGPWASLSSETGPAAGAGPDSPPATRSRQLGI